MTPRTLPPLDGSWARQLQSLRHGAPRIGTDHDGVLQVLSDGRTVVHWLLARHALLRRDGDEAQAESRAAVVRHLCAELAVHLHVEEALLYPALRDQLTDSAVIDRAEIELECLRDQMDRLVDMHPDDPSFDARVSVLVEIFDLHTQRVLAQVATQLRAATLHTLGTQMAEQRDRLLADLTDRQHGLHFENEEADPVGAPPR